jgi:oxygen-independent coproporphyrinogen-3 oxidase
VSSISQVGRSIFQNPKDVKEYYKAVDLGSVPVCKGLTLTQDDVIRAAVIRQLICHFELDMNAVSKQFNIDFKIYFQESLTSLKGLVDDKMLEVNFNHIKVTAKGLLFIRIICMSFDAHLQSQAKLQRFSRVI